MLLFINIYKNISMNNKNNYKINKVLLLYFLLQKKYKKSQVFIYIKVKIVKPKS